MLDAPGKSFGLTAADISLAALGAPLIRVPCLLENFGAPAEQLPAPLIELGLELRKTRAGQHILDARERHRPAVDGVVVVKTGNRNRVPWKEILCAVSLVGSAVVAIMARRRVA